METRVLVVPGGTAPGAVAMAHAALHKLVELHEERLRDPDHPAPHTVVVLRAPEDVAPSTLRGASTAAADAFPEDSHPEVHRRLLEDPQLLDDIDLVIPTSGSTSGSPRLVGLSIETLLASAEATHEALEGPGRWILALPAHHIAGAMVLLRAAAHEIPPAIVDTTSGFSPRDLLPAITSATRDDLPSYLSLVPMQLRACLDSDDEVREALTRLTAVLVGGAGTEPELLEAARAAGIRVHTTYGMTETAGGCVYDGVPLPGVTVRAVDIDGQSRLAITGPTLMTRHLDGPSPFLEEAGVKWLLTGDLGQINAAGEVEFLGRADEVITSGGLSIAPDPVRRATASAPGVVEACILGVPDERWGEIVTAAVTADPRPVGAEEVEAFARALRDHVGSIVGRVMAPRLVVILDDMPRRSSGKTDRHAVAELVAQRLDGPDAWRR